MRCLSEQGRAMAKRTAADRRRWQCPRCARRYEIPSWADDPQLCPQCRKAGAADAGQSARDADNNRRNKSKARTDDAGSASEIDLYTVLGVGPDSTADAIRDAYRSRAKTIHPDRFDREKQPREWETANRMLAELNRA